MRILPSRDLVWTAKVCSSDFHWGRRAAVEEAPPPVICNQITRSSLTCNPAMHRRKNCSELNAVLEGFVSLRKKGQQKSFKGKFSGSFLLLSPYRIPPLLPTPFPSFLPLIQTLPGQGSNIAADIFLASGPRAIRGRINTHRCVPFPNHISLVGDEAQTGTEPLPLLPLCSGSFPSFLSAFRRRLLEKAAMACCCAGKHQCVGVSCEDQPMAHTAAASL